jgi:hypothetical protein
MLAVVMRQGEVVDENGKMYIIWQGTVSIW